MRVLLFTHKIDIDGMGCAVLAKLVFNDCDVIYCETFEVTDIFEKCVRSGKIFEYDKIFVTDLCLKQPYIAEVSKDKNISSKLQIIDHHLTAINEGCGDYSFSTIKVEDEKGLCSGTSLFYQYLKENGCLKEEQAVAQFVELTRRYDTWEWKTIYNDQNANYLNILFTLWGIDKYVDYYVNSLSKIKQFEFTQPQLEEIYGYIKATNEKCNHYLKNMKVKNFNTLRAGIVEIDNDYRNIFSQYLRDNNIDVDFVVMKITDRGTVSFRSIKAGVDVRKIAEYFGGGGHKEASSCQLNSDIEEFIEK